MNQHLRLLPALDLVAVTSANLSCEASAAAATVIPLPFVDLPAEVGAADWDALFDAVRDRLVGVVAEPPAQAPSSRLDDASAGIRSGVLQCVEALDQLHAMLRDERLRRRQIQFEVFEAQTALTHAMVDFVVTEAGPGRVPAR